MPKNIRIASTELTSSGLLQVNVVNVQNNFPIRNARIRIASHTQTITLPWKHRVLSR